MASFSSNQLVHFNSWHCLSVSENELQILFHLLAVGPPFPPLLLSYLQNFFPSWQHLVNCLCTVSFSRNYELTQVPGASVLNLLAIYYFRRFMGLVDCGMPISEGSVRYAATTSLRKRNWKECEWKDKKENLGAVGASKKTRGCNEVFRRAIGSYDQEFSVIGLPMINSDLYESPISGNRIDSSKLMVDGQNISWERGTVEEAVTSSKIIDTKSPPAKLILDAVPFNESPASDACHAGGNLMNLNKESTTTSFLETKDEDEVKLALWDELFGFVPDSEDSKKSSVGHDCLVDEPNNMAEEHPTGSPRQLYTPSKRSRTSETVQETVKDSTRRVLFDTCVPGAPLMSKEDKVCEKRSRKNFTSDKTKPMPENEFKNDTSIVLSDMPLQNVTSKFPHFESFIVEEEEGSGGYATVYKARKLQDGSRVAIKCPYINAHKNNVINEIRMLQRFGGKNFVINYQNSVKCKSLDCLVLEYVEHDRPELLKKEIDVLQLRWYGYCLFRALASLHKQGIAHRDVKPGNFLFSRKINKGYLIDFNLALDLHQKYGTTNKSKLEKGSRSSYEVIPVSKSFQTTRTVGSKSSSIKQEDTNSRNDKKRNVVRTKDNDTGVWNNMKSQGTDGSVITSVKDMTSVRTTSGERRREPLPCQGRKELLSLLHETMQSTNSQTSTVPLPMRRRVAAPPGRVDWRTKYPSPMPLSYHGSVLADSKLMKEGPCAGTKGFRAPEVLLRSMHQGTKIDVWSAGVTLLYLMTGRTPFYGDPEQNLKDIANLRGSEDLWEVSKLHNRESAFPKELYGRQHLSSVSILEWCKINTRRREFLKQIPSSLFDLVDKCLTVNPRQRISAEDALEHEFFAQFHQRLKKSS